MATSSTSRTSLRALAEHAYRPRESLEGWLRSLVAEAASLFARDLGVVGRLWDGGSRVTVGDYAIAVTSSRVEAAYAVHRRRSAHRVDFLRHAAVGPPCSTRFRVARGARSDDYLRRMYEHFRGAGVYDMREVTVGTEGFGAGLWLTLGVVRSGPGELAGTAASWTKLRRHLAAALHAQHTFEALRSRFDGAGAASAHGVRHGLCELDAASSGLRADDAARLWCELSRGALVTLDRFERDGRRYHVLAPRDDRFEAEELTPSEREVAALVASGRSEKWISLTLGVARSTAVARMKSVLAKCGLRSRLELVRAFRVHEGCAVPALSLRAHALEGGRYLVAFDLTPSPRDATERPRLLTSAQWRVVDLALAGFTDRGIAERLRLSRHTVSHHLRHAYARLGVGSRAELFADLRRPS